MVEGQGTGKAAGRLQATRTHATPCSGGGRQRHRAGSCAVHQRVRCRLLRHRCGCKQAHAWECELAAGRNQAKGPGVRAHRRVCQVGAWLDSQSSPHDAPMTFSPHHLLGQGTASTPTLPLWQQPATACTRAILLHIQAPPRAPTRVAKLLDQRVHQVIAEQDLAALGAVAQPRRRTRRSRRLSRAAPCQPAAQRARSVAAGAWAQCGWVV